MGLILPPARVVVKSHSQGLHWAHSRCAGKIVMPPRHVPHSYHRKLRAMKASKEARKTAAGVMPPVSAIPGTNVYNTER